MKHRDIQNIILSAILFMTGVAWGGRG